LYSPRRICLLDHEHEESQPPMKRAPLVLAGTVVGLTGLLSFRTPTASVSLGPLPTTPGTTTTTSPQAGGSGRGTTTTTTPHQGGSGQGTTTTTTHTGGSGQGTTTTTTTPTRGSGGGTTTTTTPATTTTTAPPATTTTTTPGSTRSAIGASVNYFYGVISVKVTARGTTITNVTIASLSDGGNFRSQSIDNQSIPILEQQALAAQSANIQGVGGASYTSAGFERSLQSALTQLGL